MYFKLPAEAYFVLQSNFAFLNIKLVKLNVFIKECDLFLFLIDKCVIKKNQFYKIEKKFI